MTQITRMSGTSIESSDKRTVRPSGSYMQPEAKNEFRNALGTIRAMQETQRLNARDAANIALDRVVANGMTNDWDNHIDRMYCMDGGAPK
jgi:hypothetical protein